MEYFQTSNLTEHYIKKRMMDTQIGALNVARSKHTPAGLRYRDPETDYKVRRVASQVNDAITLAANEPTLGYYRIQEHVHRTLPQLIQRKIELKENSVQIEDINYDIGLSTNVVESISNISHFTRIQEALTTAIELKRKLNLAEEQEKARLQADSQKAYEANKSISLNEHAEGYICPVCYYALTSQDALISHWQQEHSLDNYENDVFQEIGTPEKEQEYVLNQIQDITVIDVVQPHISECEDVVNSFKEDSIRISEVHGLSASDASNETTEFETNTLSDHNVSFENA